MNRPDFITLYGKSYAASAEAAAKAIPELGGTFNGFYEATASGIFLHDGRQEARVFIRRDGMGPVSTFTDKDGRQHYMFSTCTTEDLWLGAPDRYSEVCNGAQDLASAIYGKDADQ